MGWDNERDLEQELGELGSRIDYPAPPGLARAARRRIDEENEERAARQRGFRFPATSPPWAAAAAMFLVFLTVPVFSPAARDALTGWLVAGPTAGDSARSNSENASGSPAPNISAEHGESGAGTRSDPESMPGAGSLPFRERITLAEARARTGEDHRILLPTAPGLGEPDEVYAVEPSHEDGIALVWRARPDLPPVGGTEIGLILTAQTGGLESAYFAEPPDNARLEEVRVGHAPGYWLTNETTHSSAVRRTGDLPSNVLLWESGDQALRLESNLPEEEAIRIAGSVR